MINILISIITIESIKGDWKIIDLVDNNLFGPSTIEPKDKRIKIRDGVRLIKNPSHLPKQIQIISMGRKVHNISSATSIIKRIRQLKKNNNLNFTQGITS